MKVSVNMYLYNSNLWHWELMLNKVDLQLCQLSYSLPHMPISIVSQTLKDKGLHLSHSQYRDSNTFKENVFVSTGSVIIALTHRRQWLFFIYLSLHEPFHSLLSPQGFLILTSLSSPLTCFIYMINKYLWTMYNLIKTVKFQTWFFLL